MDVTTALAQSSVFSSRQEDRGGDDCGYIGNVLKHKEHCNLGVSC